MPTEAQKLLDFTLLQSVAECYLNQAETLGGARRLRDVLAAGNNNLDRLPEASPDDPLLRGATRLTPSQIDYFLANFQIVTHYPNDSSGFSATLFLNTNTGEYTLSIRSTEYAVQDLGGDWELDGNGTGGGADNDIADFGFAAAQLASMETMYAKLKQGLVWSASTGDWVPDAAAQVFANSTYMLNVTGYSLGAHMATSFALMHPQVVAETYTFNAAGVGGIYANGSSQYQAPTGQDIRSIISLYELLKHWNGLESSLPGDTGFIDMHALFDPREQYLSDLEAYEYELTNGSGPFDPTQPVAPVMSHEVALLQSLIDASTAPPSSTGTLYEERGQSALTMH